MALRVIAAARRANDRVITVIATAWPNLSNGRLSLASSRAC